MPAERLLPSDEARELVALAADICAKELEPRIAQDEAEAHFPREVFTTLGQAGLLSLPYPERFGGGEQPFEVYLQVLEEIAYRSASVAVGVSVHALSCYPLANFGTDAQREEHLARLLSGDLLGAYCLSEPHAGSDPAALKTTATPPAETGGDYILSGTKAWVTHGGAADFYTVFARTGEGRGGISCFLVDAATPGMTPHAPERKMGLTASPTTQIGFENAAVPASRLIGTEGQGLTIALSALDSGRLGIAAAATGLAQRALDDAVAYAKEREAFGRPIIDHQGLGFLLADMAAAVESARATTLAAARLRDAGRPFSRSASIAKLIATDAAMKVTEDAVQVLGGAGYTKDYPVERYMREAKVFQIFEGTNQVQRLVISRHLARA
ncbi:MULTISPECIES: acyl-CoA dehydrogenase family protein [unclassified Pseudofrankia]|uniref:acyl-CoA dehydrogenase family protein n=1 Tax=unclassified Pseudofrankia TaxID=2994372 RepID=UPI0008DB17F9|nr:MULTISPECIES: acyl-CoA dehydrogenase family protein [unclassified Pseudofrankia]MDT3445591.1 acyl-CoA dehydrogenase family protein [Pseudofrankia sp. BMG5.37]OHV47813.1 acyl-CoA dehydrogenase [Pseudofrankia sp. BMG5.36]